MSSLDAHPTASWSPLHDKFYRRVPVYKMGWSDVDLEQFDVVSAPFGGPIAYQAYTAALVRAEKRLHVARDHHADAPSVMLFTASGRFLSQFRWDAVRVVKIGWTDDERLLCICANGIVLMYNLFGEAMQFTLGSESREEGVIDGRIWGTGLVALLSNFQFVFVSNLKDVRARRLADAVPPQCSLSRSLELYVAIGSTIVVVDQQEAQDQLLNEGPFTRVSVSPNGKLIALFTTEGKVSVVTADFQRRLSDARIYVDNLPFTRLLRCGTDSVILVTDEELVVIGPFGDCIRYNTSDVAHLVTEIDGTRAITAKESFIIQKVP
ncbi:hypothetical protein THASP1DRAFT_25652, partial [Thamnocephalis sphaerospora]